MYTLEKLGMNFLALADFDHNRIIYTQLFQSLQISIRLMLKLSLARALREEAFSKVTQTG